MNNFLRFGIIVVAMVMLGMIFIRRYMVVERGVVGFRFLGKKSSVHNPHMAREHAEAENAEVTTEELLPDPATIDAKDAAKADTLYRRAEASMNKGDLSGAEKLFIQSLSLDPSRKEAYHKLGLLYLRQEQASKAEMMYRKLASNFPSDAVYLSNLGLALYQQKKLAEAKGFYLKAVEIDATRAGRFFSLGQILFELGERELALQNYHKALDLDPKNIDYLLTLADLFLEAGMNIDAQAMLEKALFLDPQDSFALEMVERLKKAKQPSHGKTF